MTASERIREARERRATMDRISERIKYRQEEINRYRKALQDEDYYLGHDAKETQAIISMLEGFQSDDEDRLTDLHLEEEGL